MHRRQIVRDAAIAQLTGLALTGTNVFRGSRGDLPDRLLPALRVSTPGDALQTDGNTLGGSSDFYRIQLRVDVEAKAADGVEDLVDAICEQVEAAIAGNATLGGACQWVEYQSADIDLEIEDQPKIQASLTFEAEFIQQEQ